MRGFWGEIHRRGAEIAEVSQRFNRRDLTANLPAGRQVRQVAKGREEIPILRYYFERSEKSCISLPLTIPCHSERSEEPCISLLCGFA